MSTPERITVVDIGGKCKPLYKEFDYWVRPILEEFGQMEWGRNNWVISLEIAEPSGKDSEEGWVMKKLAENTHYLVGISSFEAEGKTNYGFFIKTGGEPVFSKDLTKEGLKGALKEALEFGPTHLPFLKKG